MNNTTQMQPQQGLILEIWHSFRSLPAWVQIWVAFILMPMNMASLLFISQPMGIWVAILTNIGMMMNMPVMLHDRGFSKMMALPHLLPWTILVALILFARPAATGLYDMYLSALLVTNVISLLFDYPDAVKWFSGDRTPAGK